MGFLRNVWEYFRDTNDDVVAFSGTSNVTFDAENRNFESVDVFTSWDDKARVETKIKNFENLWANKTNYVEIYDLVYAERKKSFKIYKQNGQYIHSRLEFKVFHIHF